MTVSFTALSTLYKLIDVVMCMTGIGLSLNGVNYNNNSIFNIMDIGTDSAALLCTTTYGYCCWSAFPATKWYFPNGKEVPNPPDRENASYYRTRSSPYFGSFRVGAVRLNRNPEGTTTGIFHCDIYDANGNIQSLYVGIYSSTIGTLLLHI